MINQVVPQRRAAMTSQVQHRMIHQLRIRRRLLQLRPQIRQPQVLLHHHLVHHLQQHRQVIIIQHQVHQMQHVQQVVRRIPNNADSS